MSKNDPRKALGKGLHSLLPARPQVAEAKAPADGNVTQVPIDQVKPNPNQPRRDFDPAAMRELTQSIERDGIIQPIIVRRIASTTPEAFEIIAGERRWRAARSAGLTHVPVIPRTADDQKVLELAIVENIQREDLNPIELAQAFHRMGAELGLSHDQIGEKTGKDRATITNTIRLLQLPEDLQQLVSTQKLTPGHARALLKIEDPQAQRELAQRSIREGWTVRRIEEQSKPAKEAKPAAKVDPNVKAAIGELESRLGTKVRIIDKGKEKGQIEIEYYSQEDLDRIYTLITGD